MTCWTKYRITYWRHGNMHTFSILIYSKCLDISIQSSHTRHICLIHLWTALETYNRLFLINDNRVRLSYDRRSIIYISNLNGNKVISSIQSILKKKKRNLNIQKHFEGRHILATWYLLDIFLVCVIDFHINLMTLNIESKHQLRSASFPAQGKYSL